MELLCFLTVLLAFLLLVVLLSRPVARYVHWRGPREETLSEVEREHLRLFTPMDAAHLEDDL